MVRIFGFAGDAGTGGGGGAVVSVGNVEAGDLLVKELGELAGALLPGLQSLCSIPSAATNEKYGGSAMISDTIRSMFGLSR